MNETQSAIWRIWVDTKNRIVSFHEAEGCQLMEFHNREMFLSYIDGFTGRQYRYQYNSKKRAAPEQRSSGAVFLTAR